MSSIATTEPPILRSIPFFGAAATANRRSYSCYNCNFSFYITPTATTSASSPSSFRCPRCHHRHLIPYHTVSPPPPPPYPPPPLPRRPVNSDYVPSIFTYQTSDESDTDYDYDSENSLLSFSPPDLDQPTPALKSFVDSLPIKVFPPNSAPSIQSCSICMEDLEINFATVNELPCQHYFHKDCIVEWLQRSNTCPLCRYELPVDPSAEQGAEEYEAVLVVNLGPIREPTMRRVSAEGNLSSIAASDRTVIMNANGTMRRVSAEGNFSSIAASNRTVIMNANGGERSGSDFDAMHDEDGDTLMIDA